jgi:MFS family permease
MNLEQIAAAMTDQYPTGSMHELDRKEKQLERFGRIAFGGFGIVIGIAVIGLIVTIFSKMILTGSQFWVGIVLVAFIVFAALALAFVFLNEDLKERRKAMARPAAKDSGLGAVTNELLLQPPASQFVSVTEDTTELLSVEHKTRRL